MTRDEKEKMEQSFGCTFGNGDSCITSVSVWREKCGTRRCRNLSKPIVIEKLIDALHDNLLD